MKLKLELGGFVVSGKMIFIGSIILVLITWSSARQLNCDEKGPVCGNDGKTYKTMCQLIWARFEDSDLAVLHEGSCTGKYIPEMASAVISDGSGSGKMLLKLSPKKKNKRNEKINAIMPIGWPPLGPMLITLARPDVILRRKNY